jgi:DnaJ-domain-containing protein 1
MISAYPLTWPLGWKRTAHPTRSLFKVTQWEATTGVLQELQRLGARSVVLSSNVRLRKDGLPYADQREPDDSGVAVYFNLDGEQQCIPCDKWSTVRENLRAVERTVEALRGLERWGAKDMVHAAFRGFKALPSSIEMGPGTARAWYEVLEVTPTTSAEVVKASYKQLALNRHPDHGGSDSDFNELQRAYEQWKAQQ